VVDAQQHEVLTNDPHAARDGGRAYGVRTPLLRPVIDHAGLTRNSRNSTSDMNDITIVQTPPPAIPVDALLPRCPTGCGNGTRTTR
jgi:hypothetical protein